MFHIDKLSYTTTTIKEKGKFSFGIYYYFIESLIISVALNTICSCKEGFWMWFAMERTWIEAALEFIVRLPFWNTRAHLLTVTLRRSIASCLSKIWCSIFFFLFDMWLFDNIDMHMKFHCLCKDIIDE